MFLLGFKLDAQRCSVAHIHAESMPKDAHIPLKGEREHKCQFSDNIVC
jgi:hypothetical protein